MALVNAESAKVLTALNNLGVQNLLLTFKEKLEALSQNLEIVNGMDTNCNANQAHSQPWCYRRDQALIEMKWVLAIGALLEAVEDKDQLQERPVPRATVWMIRDADRAVAVERNVCWQPRREQDTLVFFRHLDRGIKDRMSDCQDQLRRLPEQQPESRGNVVRRGALTRERLFS